VDQGGLRALARRRPPTAHVHRLLNLLAKPPDDPALHERVRCANRAALDEASSPTDAERRLRVLIGEPERPYPNAAACLAEDLLALCAHLRYVPRLRKRLRSSNLLKRSLEEVCRRTRSSATSPAKTSARAHAGPRSTRSSSARALGLTDLQRRDLAAVRDQRTAEPASARMIAPDAPIASRRRPSPLQRRPEPTGAAAAW